MQMHSSLYIPPKYEVYILRSSIRENIQIAAGGAVRKLKLSIEFTVTTTFSLQHPPVECLKRTKTQQDFVTKTAPGQKQTGHVSSAAFIHRCFPHKIMQDRSVSFFP